MTDDNKKDFLQKLKLIYFIAVITLTLLLIGYYFIYFETCDCENQSSITPIQEAYQSLKSVT